MVLTLLRHVGPLVALSAMVEVSHADSIDLLGDADAVASELSSSDSSRRKDALDRLLAQPIAIRDTLLVALLADPDLEVQCRAMLLVGKRQLPAHLPQLVVRLTDPNVRLRAAAAQALGRFGAESLGKSREVGTALERATSDADGDVRQWALEALLKLPRERLLPSLDAIARAIEDERVAIRLVATEGAGLLHHRQLLVPLLSRLNDPAREVRSAAIEALGQIHDPRVVPALIRSATEGPDEVRGQALLALGQLGSPVVMPFLRQMLAEGPERLRGRAAQALGLAGRTQEDLAPQIAQGLVALWSRDELRPTLAEALLTLGAKAAPALADLLGRPGLPDAEGVVRLLGLLAHEGNVKPLLEELTRHRTRPEMVIFALGRHLPAGNRVATPTLLGLLESEDRITAAAAMQALAGQLDARAQSVLVTLLDDRQDQVPRTELQRFAARELGRLALPAAQPGLLRLLQHNSSEVVTDAARALGRIADETATQKLESLLGHPSENVRQAAGESLAQIASPHMIVPLCRRLKPQSAAAKRDEELLPAILLALEGTLRGRSNEVARELLLGIAEQRGPALQERALAVLAAMRDPESARRITPLVLKTSLPNSTRIAATRALFGLPAATRSLTEVLLGDQPTAVRAEAAWALRGNADESAQAALKISAQHAADPAVRANAKAALAFVPSAKPHFVHVRVEDADRSIRPEMRFRIDYPGGLCRYGRTDLTGTVRDEAIPQGPFQLVLLD